MMADRRHHLVDDDRARARRGDARPLRPVHGRLARLPGRGPGTRGEAASTSSTRRWCRRDPDRTYLFDLPGRDGARARREATRRVVRPVRRAKTTISIERVRAAYRRRARQEPKRFVVIDASRARRRRLSFTRRKSSILFSLGAARAEAPMSGAPVVLLAGPGSAPARGAGARGGGRGRLRARLRPRVSRRAPRLPARAPRPHGRRAREAAPREPPAVRGGRRRRRRRCRRRSCAPSPPTRRGSPTRRRGAPSSSSTWTARRARRSARS